MFVLVVEIGRSWTGLPVVSIINWFTFTSQCKQPGSVMQHIIQISAVQIATPCTVAYQQLCLVTVIFNSETQLFFSHANSLKKTILIVPWEVQMHVQDYVPLPLLGVFLFVFFYYKCLRFSEIGAGREPALWMSCCWHVPTFSVKHFSLPFVPLPPSFSNRALETLNAIILWFCLNLAACEQEKEPNVLPEWSGGETL